ncbi:MAG TPA: orotate phosphoribosyltransferase [Candidatus Saccharimonadales bacterium]|nr:orotate phosphoribosyltransferase [Candidatus Saccharimonadales bacterium]
MSKVSDKAKRDVALSLHKYGILQFGEFKLKSGLMSPFYIDMRIVQSFPEALHDITAIYAELLEDLPQDIKLAGIPEAGIPLATAVGYETRRPLIQPRAKVKEHGKGKLIEGDWKPGDKVAIIDDLVAKGDSKIESIERFRECDLEVVGFYLLLDREMGGKEIVEKAGYSLEAAMTITEALDILLDAGKLERGRYDEAVAFTKNSR